MNDYFFSRKTFTSISLDDEICRTFLPLKRRKCDNIFQLYATLSKLPRCFEIKSRLFPPRNCNKKYLLLNCASTYIFCPRNFSITKKLHFCAIYFVIHICKSEKNTCQKDEKNAVFLCVLQASFIIKTDVEINGSLFYTHNFGNYQPIFKIQSFFWKLDILAIKHYLIALLRKLMAFFEIFLKMFGTEIWSCSLKKGSIFKKEKRRRDGCEISLTQNVFEKFKRSVMIFNLFSSIFFLGKVHFGVL